MSRARIKQWITFLLFTITIHNNMQAQENNTAKRALNSHQQTMATIAALTAIGNQDELKKALNKGLDAGLAINEIKEALVQLYAYCGFPRSLNAIGTYQGVLNERKAKGVIDKEGKAIIVENPVPDKYEQGRQVLEDLT